MAWKKDLAKLKQDLGKEEGLPPGKAAPPPKARPVHPVSQSIEEEDNIFLSAMGLRPKPGAPDAAMLLRDEPPAVIQPKPAPQASKVEFSTAMGDLKGLKPLGQSGVQEQPAAPPAPVAPPEPPMPAPPPPPEPVEAAPPELKEAPTAPPQVQIQLAAGMAIVVDGSLDLKGHARSDAEERLKERILDGYALGWRTLHVVVGTSADLRQMVLDLLMSPAGRCVARYAQAPVPMGGAQAWILYFRGPGTPEN
jgi:DNA-nicking Smr family endonuclease